MNSILKGVNALHADFFAMYSGAIFILHLLNYIRSFDLGQDF